MKKLLFTFVLTFVTFTANAQTTLDGDMNYDGVINVTDVTLLVNVILEKSVILTCPDANHPHMIDLGLPSGTKWACCNVGATKPEDYGGYYAWGETETKYDYSWVTYSHCDRSQSTCYNLGSSICGTKYDVAHVKWGGNCQMPTYDQCVE